MESQLTVRIPLSLSDRLEQVARELHRKRSDLVRMALEKPEGVHPPTRYTEIPPPSSAVRGNLPIQVNAPGRMGRMRPLA